jgi:antitoxin VapB
MSLNIKNPEAHALAARLAKKTGETLTDAVTTALRERLERVEQAEDFDEALYEKLKAIAAD